MNMSTSKKPMKQSNSAVSKELADQVSTIPEAVSGPSNKKQETPSDLPQSQDMSTSKKPMKRLHSAISKQLADQVSTIPEAVSGPSNKKQETPSDLPQSLRKIRPLKRQKRVTEILDSDDDDDDLGESTNLMEMSNLEIPAKQLPKELLESFYKTPGFLMISGMVSWDLVAKRLNPPKRKTHPDLYTFHRFTDVKYRLIISGCSAGHSILVSAEGDALTFGRNACGQLGFGDTVTRNIPEVVPTLKGLNIIHAAVGRNHSLFVTDTGTVYACGDNKSGQCGVGHTTAVILTPTPIKYKGPPIVKVGCGAEFSIILDCNGALHSFGLPEYGQLGHNTDGKFFVTSTKLSYHFETVPKKITFFYEKTKDNLVMPINDVAIVDFSCGNNHTVAIDSNKRAYSWGFGGFGRLGHNWQKDEAVPRLIKFFDTNARGLRSVHCGATYSLAVNENGALFMFGQTKRTGEANMYPKPVQDLAGWNIRSVGTSNTSIVIAADDSLIAWGVSPTYGELGTGLLQKSTTKPKKVMTMEGLNITQVTMGFSHTLVLCNDSTDEVKQKLASMPIFSPKTV